MIVIRLISILIEALLKRQNIEHHTFTDTQYYLYIILIKKIFSVLINRRFFSNPKYYESNDQYYYIYPKSYSCDIYVTLAVYR